MVILQFFPYNIHVVHDNTQPTLSFLCVYFYTGLLTSMHEGLRMQYSITSDRSCYLNQICCFWYIMCKVAAQ
jgi:hypothetical protein